jgi:hypothetical protein
MPKKKVINWAAVEDAVARSTRGHGSQADFDICQAAFNADRETYSEVSKRVREGVHRSMNPLAKQEEDDTRTRSSTETIAMPNLQLSAFQDRGEWVPGLRILWARNGGILARRGKKWWASNDMRWDLIGAAPNSDLVQPTLGPFTSKAAALNAYNKARNAPP